jgi:hypothetical protein
MARDRRRWDKDMAAARRLREVHELACRQAHRARQAGDEGSNTVDLGWGDDLL